MAHPMYDDDVLTGEMTRKVVSEHGDILQFHQGDDQDAHIDWLLSVYDFPEGATICDVGCGVGGVAWRMAKKRPDLKWVLLNISAEQLKMCPDIGEKIQSDMHELPENIDVVMVNYALGHSTIRKFASACGKTKTAYVMLYEPVPDKGVDSLDLDEQLKYTFRSLLDILRIFGYAGFDTSRIVQSPHTKSASADAYGIDLYGIKSLAIRLVRFGEPA